MKGIHWHGDTKKVARTLPEQAKSVLGHELHKLQLGLMPSDWKPMSSIGPGVREIRIHADGEYRAIFLAEFDSQIHVLHVFRKKSRKTAGPDVEIARIRYRALMH